MSFVSLIHPLLAQQPIGDDELYPNWEYIPKPSPWPMIFWIVLALLVIAIAVGVLVYALIIKKRTAPGASPAAQARQRFSQLEQKREIMELGEYSQALSDTLKDYLSAKFQDPVRYETSYEFLQRISSRETKLPDAAQQELGHFLVESEELKFANLDEDEATAVPLARRAENILNLCESISGADKQAARR
ncbi:MAG: hypothetical protein CMO55_08805 [Verrucomicrobiales bacterium]|nr:hypothetical protein [Verrucomicrobiales bacterium]